MAEKRFKLKQNKSFMAKKEEVQRRWFLLDAEGKTLGRLATEIAKILRGKHKPTYTPHVDTGDGVIIINAEKVVVTGAKEAQKVYRHHTGFIGGLKEIPYRTMMARHPERIIESAVNGMMPKTRLGRAQKKRLRVLVGADHDLAAKQPIAVNI